MLIINKSDCGIAILWGVEINSDGSSYLVYRILRRFFVCLLQSSTSVCCAHINSEKTTSCGVRNATTVMEATFACVITIPIKYENIFCWAPRQGHVEGLVCCVNCVTESDKKIQSHLRFQWNLLRTLLSHLQNNSCCCREREIIPFYKVRAHKKHMFWPFVKPRTTHMCQRSRKSVIIVLYATHRVSTRTPNKHTDK